MADDDDDRWLAGLAGRPADGDDAGRLAAEREGHLMRDALLRWAPFVQPDPHSDPARLAKLLARARAEGLLDARAPVADRAVAAVPVATSPVAAPSVGARLRAAWRELRSLPHFGRWATTCVAAAMVAIVYFGQPRSPDAANDDTVRASPDTVTVLHAADPAALRTEIVDALSRGGIHASTYTRFGRLGIDADLPAPLPVDVRAVLARYRIPPPRDGVLRVEIDAAR